MVVGFKASVVPEPETYALLLAGLGIMGFIARRRRAS
ncbi:MAG: PEP-CTERM sorting domain-containing protein [Burkholderiales bacterium]|nr:PEP-CTERM sorting domain-containing protein [Burkholderiales bacterium]